MCSFFVLEKRNLQPGLREGDFLQFVEVFGLLLRAFMQNRIGEREEATSRPDFTGMSSCCKPTAGIHLFWDGLAKLVDIDTRQVELADLFFESHSPEQVVNAHRDGLLGVEIHRNLCGRLRQESNACC